MFHRACAVAALLGLACLPAGAEDFGQIAFSFDGKEHEWPTFTRQAGEKTIASARLTKTGRVNTMTIDAYEKQTDTRSAILNVQLLYMTRTGLRPPRRSTGDKQASTGSQAPAASPDYGRPTSVGIIFFTGGARGPVWQGRNAKVEIQSHDLSGDVGRMKASFSAEMCFAEKLHADPDESRCQPISGTIETRVVLPADG